MRLKDLNIKYYKGKPPRIKEGNSHLPYLTPDYIRKGSTPEYFPMQPGVILVEDGELILLWDGSNAGEFFKGKKGILASTMVKFDKVEEAEENYFYYSLKLQEQTLKSKTAGSGIPHVDKESLFNLEVYLPEKSHQSTIATILSTIDQAIEKTEQLITKYERIKTGLMQDLLTRGIDEQGNIRSEETHEFKDSPLGRIPREWEFGIFGEIANLVTSKYLPSSKEVLPCINLENLLEGQGMLDGFSSSSENTSIKNQFRKNDVLFGKLRPYLRKFWHADFNGVCTTEILVFRENENSIGKFIFFVVQSDRFINHSIGLSFGTKMPRTDWKTISSFQTPIIPKSEQIRIVEVITQNYELVAQEREALRKLVRIKTSLMQDLLTGNVRVDALMNQKQKII